MKVKLWMLAFASVVLLPFVAMAEAALPKAAVTRCAPVTLTQADHNYMVWPSGDATVDRPLQIVMNFKAQESLEEAKAGAYGKYKCDFYLSIEGLAETSIVEGYSRKAITANDCYLAGNYGSFGWIVIPTDGLVLEEGISYPVVSAYDANLTYEDICGSVKDFTAAIYVAPAILAANPDFKVSLALKMTDPNDASKVLTIGEPATYTVKDLLMPTATVSTLANEELTFALNFKADKVSPEALEYFGSWYADFELFVNKETVFNANGGANGYLSGQYDAWSENWVNVPFEDVTLAANEPLKIMAYAAKMLGQSGLKLTYRDVYEGVKDFDCGVFFEPDFLTANPDLEVTLELRMYNPANESESYVIGKTYVFTLGEKPTVVIPENVTAPEGVQNNATVEETPVVLPAEVKTFEISLASVTTEATETAKVTFNVEPKNAEGVKVAAPSKAITFRLPLPSAWSGFAKVTHEDEFLGIYDIQEANGNKFVEITSQAFSEYVVEQSDIVLPSGVTSASFGTDTVTDGTTYYATLQAAVEAVCGTAGATLYCKPGADVGALQHAPVTATLTVYGNGASVSGGAERDFDIGNTDPNGGKDITADMTLTVKDLDGCGAWGAKATTHTVNLVFDGCRNMGKVFITGTTGTLNITIKDASFEGVIKEAVYSNADGAITLSKVDFSNLNKAVNLNHKAAGTQTVAIENCSFTNCGADVAADQIPVRVLSSVEGGKSVLTVSGTTFTGTPEGGADILLDYGVGETTATISTADTAANVVVEKTNNVGTTTTVPANTQNQSFATVEPVAKIGEKTYSSLQAALAVAQAGNTIKLLQDVVCTEKPVFTNGGIVNVDVNGHTFVSTELGRVRNVASADGVVPSNNIQFVSGFGWEVYQYNGMPTTNVEFRVFPTLEAAVTYDPSTNNPARIYPYQDITQEADVTLKAYPAGTSSTICVDPGYEIVWDLNGYSVTQESSTGNPLEACIRGKLTLVDSSDTQTGKWIAGACGVKTPSHNFYGGGGPAFYVLGEGELILKGGTVSIARNATLDAEGNEIINTGGLIRLDDGNLTVDGATLQVDDTYGIMIWGGEAVIQSGTFELLDPSKSWALFAMYYYAPAKATINSLVPGDILVVSGADVTVNVPGVQYYEGNGYVAPSVGEGLMAFDGFVLEAGEAVVTTETTITPYATLAEAFTAAQPGDTVTIMSGTYNQGLTVDKAFTVVGATDAEGNNLVTFNGTLNVTAEGATVKNINVNNPSGNGGRITVKNVLIEGCSVVGANGFRYCYTTGTVTFKDSVIAGQTYGIHFDGSDGGNIVIDNCVITGWTSFAGTITNVAIEDTTFANGNYNQLRFYQNAQMTNVKFNEEMNIDFGKEDVDAAFTGCTVVDSEGNPSTKPLTDVIYKGDIADMGVDVTIDTKPMTVEAKIGEVYYLTLQEALNAAAKGTGEVAVDVLTDIDMTGKTWTPVRVSDPGYPFVTVNGNDKTITGLTDMLFSGTWAGKSGLVINDLTIADSTIVNDENDAIGTVGVGAFIGYPSASETITLKNCHLKNSTVKGGHWTGGLVGIAGGYSGNDGPVFMTLTFEGCSVTGSTITGKGSAGGIIGHAANDAWTNVIIKDATVSDNTITSTGSSANKAGSVMGTIGAAGQSATAGGETKQGGVAVAATTSGNAVTSAATTITTIYGRQGSSTGMLEVTGGTYEANPIEDNVTYAAPAEGYIIKQNDDGTYGLVELPAVSMTVTMNGTGMTIQPSSHTTLSEALKRLDVLGSLITLGGGISLVEITINKDIEDAESATIKYNTTINGNGKTLTYTGTDRAIEVPNTANGANVTIKDLTVVATSAERGINYNTNGTLTVENVTVTSKMYAINFPTSADNATVSIKDSELTSAIALNIWGSDMEITVTDSELYSVENDPKFSYATIQLNRDGSGNIAEGTTIVVEGGKLSAIDENGNPSIVVSNWTATGEATVSPTTEVIGSVKNAVAMVGGACFYTLQDAIDDVVNEGYTAPIVVIRDIALTETVTVPANATVTLDLNGQTVSMTKAETVTANHEMILNKGNLTIQDTVGGGKLSYQYTGASLGTSYAANTITTEPGSTLTVKSGTIENLTYEGGIIAYAVDGRTNGGLGDVTVNIEGGTITSKRQSIRIFANSTTKTGALNISGGEIIGRVIVQNASANANKAALSITGGTFNANAYKTEVLYVGGSNGATIDMTPVVSGGTFNGEITSTMTEGFISGGVFVTDVSDYCVAGYKAEQNAEGTYGIVVDPAYGKVAKVGEGYYDTLVAAVDAAAPDQTVTLLTDASGDGIIINKLITIDLNGKTYTIDGTLVGSAGTKSCGFQILSGNTVTIQNGAIVMDEDAVRGHDGLPGNNFVIQNYADLTLKDVAITGNSKTSYVVSINSGTVALTGNTSITAAGDNVAFDVYDYSSAGYAVPAVTVDTIGTIIGRIEVSEAASLAISNGTYTVAIAPEWCAEGFIPLVNGDGTYGVKQGQYLAQIGDKQYESVAAALAAARAEGVTELTITLIGANEATSTDSFNLYTETLFESVTIKQVDPSKTYYLGELYTGKRVNNGKFIFDGVNLTVTDQYIFEGNVELANNALITSTTESNCFYYYASVTIQPGSKIQGVIEDFRGGDVIVDGGKTDGSYSEMPGLQDAIMHIRWAGDNLTLKNGAYVKVNSVNEIGRLTVASGTELNVNASKLETVEYIQLDATSRLNTDTKSSITTKQVTGSGVITVTVDAFEGATKQIIAADMTGFTGTLDMVNNTECEMVYIADATGLTIMKVVAYVGNVPYATLEEIPENATGIKLLDRAAAVAAAQKVVAQSGGKVVSGGDAYDVATLLGGTFSKVVDATSQTSVLCYNYDFGVSHVQYTWADDVTLGTKVPLVNVTAAIKDADATTARTLDARALVIEVRNDAETVLRTIYVEAPAFTVQGGQVIYIHPVDVSDILTLDATLYFTVRMTDTWSNNVEEEEDVEE